MKRIASLFAVLMAWAGMALAAVNINTATKEQLETLDGVGPVKAQAIVDYRNKNGPYKALADIKKVDGIGDATFEKIRTKINLTGQTTVAQASTPAKAPSDAQLKADAKKQEADAKKAEAKAAADAKKSAADEKKAAAKTKADAKKPTDAELKADAKKQEADAKKADAKAKADAKKSEADEKKAAEKKK